MKSADEKAVEILLVNFNEGKLMNVAELTTKFSMKEIVVLGQACFGTIHEMQRATDEGKILEFFPNMMYVISYASFLHTQLQLIDNAITNLKGANVLFINDIEGSSTKTEIFLN